MNHISIDLELKLRRHKVRFSHNNCWRLFTIAHKVLWYTPAMFCFSRNCSPFDFLCFVPRALGLEKVFLWGSQCKHQLENVIALSICYSHKFSLQELKLHKHRRFSNDPIFIPLTPWCDNARVSLIMMKRNVQCFSLNECALVVPVIIWKSLVKARLRVFVGWSHFQSIVSSTPTRHLYKKHLLEW